MKRISMLLFLIVNALLVAAEIKSSHFLLLEGNFFWSKQPLPTCVKHKIVYVLFIVPLTNYP